MQRYNPKEIEPKWQKQWAEDGMYKAEDNAKKPKRYILEYFPYPSGAAMHVGHVRNYTIGDALTRHARMNGYNVLHPMGWDAFGLPAENYAIKTGVSPQEAIKQNTTRFKQQLIQMGFGYDWSREFASSDPTYYRWTQWFFLLLYKKGLAYRKESLQWWCPVDKTVLANEQVENGKCWRCGSDVEKKALKQWFFKITDYADRLARDLDKVDWSESIKTMQRNWIGGSKGAEIDFPVDGTDKTIKVFTTRPDTIFGATFIVIAPEHPLVHEITTPEHKARVGDYIRAAQAKSDVERQETNREKTGVFTGAYAVNPANNEKIPVWVADYVLYGYGTGAIMAVPAHDERDCDFAQRFHLPIAEVVAPEFGEQRDNEQWVDGVTVVAYDNTTGQCLGLDWPAGFTSIVAGGREGDEDYEACARRELQEEAGIKDIVQLTPLGSPVYAHYEHKVKNLNRVAKTQGFLAIISDRQGDGAHHEDHETFVSNWYGLEELRDKIEKRLTGNDHWLELLQRAKQAIANYHDGTQTALSEPLTGEGRMINSGSYDDMPTSEAREKIVADLEKKGVAKERINYKIRDWLISRQRYWGAPIPVIYCDKCGVVPVPEDQLPVLLPPMQSFEPSGNGRSPLARVPEFVDVECPKCGGPATRETDTMDGFACSSWYFLRFADPHDSERPFAKDKVAYWLPVDDYIGGAEHAVMHLLYARMWTKVMYDDGMIGFDEPFERLRNQGMILAPDGQKMSKSKGNTIEPDLLIEQGYGADAIRIMELFIGPWNQSANWSVEGMGGSFRFLQRVWALTQDYMAAQAGKGTKETELRQATHRAIKSVGDDLQALGFNTAIAGLMEFVNGLYKLKVDDPFASHEAWKFAIESLLQLLAPFAPHITEELWHQLGYEDSIHASTWPQYDEQYLASDTMTLAVQVNGKVRGEIVVDSAVSEADAIAAAQDQGRVKPYLEGKAVKKVIYVPGKLVSLVVA